MQTTAKLLLGIFLFSLILVSCSGSHEVCPAYTKVIKQEKIKG